MPVQDIRGCLIERLIRIRSCQIVGKMEAERTTYDRQPRCYCQIVRMKLVPSTLGLDWWRLAFEEGNNVWPNRWLKFMEDHNGWGS